jgi:hypothetical protein
MNYPSTTIELNGKKLSSKLVVWRSSFGSVTVRCGDNLLLCVASKKPKRGLITFLFHLSTKKSSMPVA